MLFWKNENTETEKKPIVSWDKGFVCGWVKGPQEDVMWNETVMYHGAMVTQVYTCNYKTLIGLSLNNYKI